MKLEKGMYVRTKITDNCNCVYIRKIDEIDDGGTLFNQICIDEDVCDSWGDERIWIDTEDILKASHNIIDLIECGDYVNGHLVTKISKDGFIWLEGYSIDGTWHYVDFINEWGDNIKSILTKQQMESMQYEVK